MSEQKEKRCKERELKGMMEKYVQMRKREKGKDEAYEG